MLVEKMWGAWCGQVHLRKNDRNITIIKKAGIPTSFGRLETDRKKRTTSLIMLVR